MQGLNWNTVIGWDYTSLTSTRFLFNPPDVFTSQEPDTTTEAEMSCFLRILGSRVEMTSSPLTYLLQSTKTTLVADNKIYLNEV